MRKAEVLFYRCRTAKQATAALKAFQSTEEPHEIFAVNRTYLSELLGGADSKGMAAWTVVIVNRGADEGRDRHEAQGCAVNCKGSGRQIDLPRLRGQHNRFQDDPF